MDLRVQHGYLRAAEREALGAIQPKKIESTEEARSRIQHRPRVKD